MAEKKAESKTEVEVTATVPSRSKSKRAKVAKVAVAVTPEPISGFVGFLREHAVVGLAVGFVIGTQVQSVIKQLIDGFINPLSQLLFPGNKALSSRTFTLHFSSRHANFGWGALVYQLINFLFILFVIYAIIKIFQLDKLDKPKT